MAGGLGFDAAAAIPLPPPDPAIMASIVKKGGFSPRIIDPEVDNISSQEIIEICQDRKPKAVITTFSLASIANDAQFVRDLKANLSTKIYVKTGVTFPPILRKFLLDSGADACLVGEPEFVINDILADKTKLGLAYLKKGKLVINMPPPVEKMDDLPLPARNLLNNSQYHYPLLGKNTTSMQTSRGCPYQCGYYCPYPLVQGKQWRAMSVDRVIKELRDIVEKHKIKYVLFRDATFTLDQKRAAQICEKIISNKIRFKWWCETRLNCLDEKLLVLMKKAGCLGMNVGVETGKDEIMKKQGKPGVNQEMLTNIKRITDKLGLKLHFLMIIGLPDETRKTLYSTFDMIRRLRPSSLGVTVITPYPGTQLYEDAVRKGWIESQDWSRYSGTIINMHTDHFSSWEMKFYQKLIQAEMYFLRKGILGQFAVAMEGVLFRIIGIL